MTVSDPVALVERARSFPTATLHEAAGRRGALPAVLRPVSLTLGLCGRAFTVHTPPGDNLWLHRAIYQAAPGDVLVVDVGGSAGYEFGYWGEIMTQAALARGLGGLVVDGGVRDSQRLVELGFPVFSRLLAIRGTIKDFQGEGRLGEPIRWGDVVIHTGDLIVGDADGLFVSPMADVEQVLEASADREAKEAAVIERLKNGERTPDIYGWP